MTISIHPHWAAIALSCMLALSAAAAQTLGQLAPPDAILVLDFERPPEVEQGLLEDLAALDWAAAADTVKTLAGLVRDEVPEGFDIGGADPFSFMGGLDETFDELAAECPEFPTDTNPAELLEAGMLTFAFPPANPFPVLTLLARVPSDRLDAAEEIQAALIDCFGSDAMTQDGTSIHILGQGSDLPLAVAQVGNVFIAASTPDAVRGVIRRAGGSTEPALADTPLQRAVERFAGTGFGFSVNLAAAADLAQSTMGQMVRRDTPDGKLVDRMIRAGRTLGGVAGRIGISQDGLLFENAVAVDPNGGDQALANLLLCRTCGVSRPFLVPGGSNGVTSQHVPVRAAVQYFQGWLDGIAESTGDDLDLRTVLRDELGIDLDVALLDWVGSQVHIAALEPFDPTLRQLVYQQPTVLIMPVSSQEAAQRGLDALAEALGARIGDMFSGMGSGLGNALGPMGSRIGSFGDSGFDSGFDNGFDDVGRGVDMFASREVTYRGVAFDRIQIGFGVDVAVALVGNNLVVASPSDAVRSVIDTFQGQRDRLDDAAFRRVLAGAPEGATAVAYQNMGANLAGVTELGRTIAQPVAALLSAVAAQAAAEETEFTEPGRPATEPLRTISYGTLPVAVSGTLTEDASNRFGDNVDRYRIAGIPAGERVTISVQSDAFDTYLYLLDAQANQLDSNDDAGFGTDSALTVVADGRDWLVDVSGFGGTATGSYTLRVELGISEDLPRIDLSGIEPQPLKVPASGDGELTDGDRLPDGSIATYFALDGLREGQIVEVILTSDAFDTYLRVVDPTEGVILAENDDNPDTSRSAVTFGATGGPVWVQITSWSESSTGPYLLEITPSEPAPATSQADSETGVVDSVTVEEAPEPVEPVEPPSFRALLELAEIVPEALAILSERVGLSIGYSHVDDTVIYRRTLLEIDW